MPCFKATTFLLIHLECFAFLNVYYNVKQCVGKTFQTQGFCYKRVLYSIFDPKSVIRPILPINA